MARDESAGMKTGASDTPTQKNAIHIHDHRPDESAQPTALLTPAPVVNENPSEASVEARPIDESKKNITTSAYAIVPEVFEHNRSAPPPPSPIPSTQPPLVGPPVDDNSDEASESGHSSALSIHASDIVAINEETDDSPELSDHESPMKTHSLPPTMPPPVRPPATPKPSDRAQESSKASPMHTQQSQNPKSINSLLAGLSRRVGKTESDAQDEGDDATDQTNQADLLKQLNKTED